MQYRAVLTLSPIATAAITAARFVSPAGAVPTAGGNTLGVSLSDAPSGQPCPVIVLGTAIVECDGAITAGALVESTNAGKAVARDTGVAVGRALQTGATGRKIEVLLIAN